MKMKKIVIALLIIAIIGAGAVWFVTNRRSAERPDSAITLYGNVDIRDVSLGFRVAGRISDVQFEEGDRVGKSAVIAVLDKQPFEDDVALYTAQLEAAEVSL